MGSAGPIVFVAMALGTSLVTCMVAIAEPAAPDGGRIASLGIAAQGVPACASCHGAKGEGAPAQGAPRLAHLAQGYLERQLAAFAAGGRASTVMEPIARQLTPGQRAVISGHYASLPAIWAAGTFGAMRLVRGKALAERGDWSVQSPPCASCHGPRGTGVGSLTPPLVGQSQDYLLEQLMLFRNGQRKSDTIGLMNGIAGRLSIDDLRAAAAYYGSLPAPNAGPPPPGAAR